MSRRTILGIRILALTVLAFGAGARAVDSGVALHWRWAHGVIGAAAVAVVAQAIWASRRASPD